MQENEILSGKRIAVVGMARSGLAAADVLASRGARVTLYDAKSVDDLAEPLRFAAERGIPAHADSEAVGPDEELLVTSPGVRRDAPILADAVGRGVPIWGEIEAAYSIARAPILAITGTNGKTTTTALLGEILRSAGIETYVAGNIAAGRVAMPLIRAADRAAADAVIVAEISSFQLEWIDRFRPVVAAILNITSDHSDRQSWDAYVGSKWRIFENQRPGDFAVLRSDTPRPDEARTLRGSEIVFDRLPRPEWLSRIRLPGEHNKENVMAALAMARAFGIDDASIETAALDFGGVVHRLEHVASVWGVNWYNNSMCTNNDAFARSLEAIAGPKVVIAGGVYKGGDTAEFGAAAAQSAVRALVCFGRSGALLDRAARAAGVSASRVVDTLESAVPLAASLAQEGDCVLLSPACASFDQFRDFEDRGERFRLLVRGLASSVRTVDT